LYNHIENLRYMLWTTKYTYWGYTKWNALFLYVNNSTKNNDCTIHIEICCEQQNTTIWGIQSQMRYSLSNNMRVCINLWIKSYKSMDKYNGNTRQVIFYVSNSTKNNHCTIILRYMLWTKKIHLFAVYKIECIIFIFQQYATMYNTTTDKN
jgi:hypothetical protein